LVDPSYTDSLTPPFIPFLAYPAVIRRIVYTTNMVESVNYQMRKASKTRGHFPDDDSALKLLRLIARDITTSRGGVAGTGTQGWAEVLNAFAIHFPERLNICNICTNNKKQDLLLHRRPDRLDPFDGCTTWNPDGP
jgi:hypothetical protein